MMDAAIQMMHDARLSSGHMTRYEADRWIEKHGELRRSFDRIVEVATPAADAQSDIQLGFGQSLMVATTGPQALDNQFWIERPDQITYRAFSMRRKNSDSVELSRYEEVQIGTFDTVEGILRGIGKYFGTPAYWAHPELHRYFTEQRLT